MESKDNFLGVFWATTIYLAWATTLTLLLVNGPFQTQSNFFNLITIVGSVLIQTHLYTGIFITCHDSMHGSVCPTNRRINDFFGTLSAISFALFSLTKLKQKHYLHHRHPGSELDPDYCPTPSPVVWYYTFMRRYLTAYQFIGMAFISLLFTEFFGLPLDRVLLFWALPSLLSTVQLFYFGTYLPHVKEETPFEDDHNARSKSYSRFMSLLTCYNFGGYHHQHHRDPSTPWWRLGDRPRV